MYVRIRFLKGMFRYASESLLYFFTFQMEVILAS